jgi:hypothetical protein
MAHALDKIGWLNGPHKYSLLRAMEAIQNEHGPDGG